MRKQFKNNQEEIWLFNEIKMLKIFTTLHFATVEVYPFEGNVEDIYCSICTVVTFFIILTITCSFICLTEMLISPFADGIL